MQSNAAFGTKEPSLPFDIIVISAGQNFIFFSAIFAFDRDAFDMVMMIVMVPMISEFKVLNPVVIFVSVFMMDDFFAFKFPP